MTIYPSQIAQILGNDFIQVAALKQDKVFIKILTKYFDYLNIFLKKKALVLLEQIDLNEHAIKLERDKTATL